MAERGNSSSMPTELVEAVSRLAAIRRHLKDLEMEESILRDEIIAGLSRLNDPRFPLRLGDHEVRLGGRAGRVNETAAMEQLNRAGLSDQVETAVEIGDAETARQFPLQVRALSMPKATRTALMTWFDTAIALRPHPTSEQLERWRSAALLDDEAYRRCFKDLKPWIPILTVR